MAKDLLQDTHEGLLSIWSSEISSRQGVAYVQFWGVLQTIVIQQDALKEMYWSLTGTKISEKKPLAGFTDRPDWLEIRNLRHKCAGHPVGSNDRQKHSQGPNVRVSIARPGLSAFTAYTTTYYRDQRSTDSTFLNLKSPIERYYKVAAEFMKCIYDKMLENWGPHEPWNSDEQETVTIEWPIEFLETAHLPNEK